MRTALTAVIAVWTWGTLACNGTTAPLPDSTPQSVVRAKVADGGLQLTNPTANTIYYAVFERDWATHGLFLWAACADPVSCPSVQAGAAVTIPYSEIGGYTPEASEALVYYWELRPEGSGHQVGEIRSFVVPF